MQNPQVIIPGLLHKGVKERDMKYIYEIMRCIVNTKYHKNKSEIAETPPYALYTSYIAVKCIQLYIILE